MEYLQSAICGRCNIISIVIDENCFVWIRVQCANRCPENFWVGLLQMELLTQKNMVKEIIQIVAACIEPFLAAVFPVQFIGVAQERNGNAFSLVKVAKCVQLAFGDTEANGIPRMLNIVWRCRRKAFAGNLLAEILRAQQAELVIFHPLVNGSTLFEFCGRKPQGHELFVCILHSYVENDPAQVEYVIFEHARKIEKYAEEF